MLTRVYSRVYVAVISGSFALLAYSFSSYWLPTGDLFLAYVLLLVFLGVVCRVVLYSTIYLTMLRFSLYCCRKGLDGYIGLTERLYTKN